ncbi:MAG TPA: ABC transporter ATP-binding protein [Clostridiaceae bacterium]|nr:ABC transporter ATP-binding protein [Clostridiaceae bacterium]
MKDAIRLLKYAKAYWKHLAIAMVALLVMTGIQLYAPMIVRKMITMITEGDPDLGRKAIELAVKLGLLYIILAFCQFLRSYLTHYAAWHFVSDMRVRIYNHMQKLSLRFYHDKQTGQLMSRTSNDTSTLESLIAHSTPDLIVNILILIGVTVILFSINPVLALLSLITVPFLAIAASYFAKRVLPQFKNSQQALAEFNATLHDNLQGIKEIQIFNQQEREKERIRRKSNSHVKTLLRVLKLSAIYHPSIEFFSNMGVVIVIGFGGYLASAGKVPLKDIVTFILYLNMFYQPISTLGRLNEDMQNALAGASRIFEVLDTESDVKEAKNPVELGRVKGRIVFENVSFSYIEGNNVLNNINLEINPGELVALVGPTGVGKTTLISLICRFYDPTEGRITIDGIDMKDVSLKSLRDNTSIVLQDVFLFNGTIAENIAYGAENATREEIIKAAKLAHAHEFIDELENGYDTIIGERGIRLSGGQKQRISIARAILRNTPVLILDEATASVDTQTEKLIHDAIDRVTKNRTTIVIAHRLSSIQKADKIVVLNEGGIEEIGTHFELLQNNGLYSKLYNIQFKGREVC